MRVGLLGGSFDPVHYGHLRAAEWALQAFGLDAVRLMPARQSPFKNAAIASDGDRLAMLNLAVKDNDALEIEACELNREPPSYTVDTLRVLTEQSPATEFTLILGSDAAAGIDEWRDASTVKQLAAIAILHRPGDPAPPQAPTFDGPAVSSTQIRTLIRSGHSIRYLTPEPVRRYIEEKGLYK
ncbi:MAG: nicotinate (nicotinamide) nucleotide adenylyltransferase [Vicinamibacteria bacterium]